MKRNNRLFLKEEQVRELLEGYGEPEYREEDTDNIRTERLLKHYHFSMYALTGANN